MDRFGTVVATAALPTAALQKAAARAALREGADRAEVRLDRLDPGEDREDLLALAAEIPLLVSGNRHGTTAEELDLLRRAQTRGAWVDLPADPEGRAETGGLDPRRLVLSWHGTLQRAEDLDRLAGRLLDSPAARVKIVLEVSRGEEALSLLDLWERHGKGRLVAFASGYAGFFTRVLSLSRGSAAVYAAAPGAPPAAEGQPDLSILLKTYRLRRFRPVDPVYGVAGWPLRHTGSPALHNRWLARFGLPGVFLPFPFQSLEALLEAAPRLNLRGLAVTMPFKGRALSLAESASRRARFTGAANTLLRGDGRPLLAANTDLFGVRSALCRLPPFREVLLLGAGGAAAAVAAALPAGSALTVTSRDLDRTRAFARRFNARTVLWPDRGLHPWDLLIQATPAGQEGEETPFPFPLRGKAVFDLVVRPGGTPLLREARAQGLSTVGGEVMLEAQARLQFRLFTGKSAPVDPPFPRGGE